MWLVVKQQHPSEHHQSEDNTTQRKKISSSSLNYVAVSQTKFWIKHPQSTVLKLHPFESFRDPKHIYFFRSTHLSISFIMSTNRKLWQIGSGNSKVCYDKTKFLSIRITRSKFKEHLKSSKKMCINDTFISLYFSTLSDTDYSYRWQLNRKVDWFSIEHSSRQNTD